MEAVIKVRPEELKTDLFDLLKSMVKNRENLEIIIQVKERTDQLIMNEPTDEYLTTLEKSIEDRANSRTVSFTMEEFEKYVRENFSE